MFSIVNTSRTHENSTIIVRNRVRLSLFSINQTLSATRSFALRERGFVFISSSDGSIGFLFTLFNVCTKPQVHTGASRGQVQPFSRAAIAVFTILSSSEWKLMTHSLPPTRSLSGAVSIIALHCIRWMARCMRAAAHMSFPLPISVICRFRFLLPFPDADNNLHQVFLVLVLCRLYQVSMT